MRLKAKTKGPMVGAVETTNLKNKKGFLFDFMHRPKFLEAVPCALLCITMFAVSFYGRTVSLSAPRLCTLFGKYAGLCKRDCPASVCQF